MGDFAGGTLKYLKRKPVPRVTLAGGFAKLAKLAQGHLDLHSSRSTVDVADLASELAVLDPATRCVQHAGLARRVRCWPWRVPTEPALAGRIGAEGQGQGAGCGRRQAGAGGAS